MMKVIIFSLKCNHNKNKIFDNDLISNEGKIRKNHNKLEITYAQKLVFLLSKNVKHYEKAALRICTLKTHIVTF